jgi:hypothetical protein
LGAWLTRPPTIKRLGASFNLGPRFLQRGLALLPTGDLFGNAQPVLQGRAVGLLGFGQQFFDLPIQLLDGFARVFVADGGVLAGMGQHLGSIHRHGDLADLQKLQRLRHARLRAFASQRHAPNRGTIC